MNFNEYKNSFQNILNNLNEDEINNFIGSIISAFDTNNTIFVIGNGGSAANASHLAQDLAKGTMNGLNQKKRIKALSLTDNLPFVTALGNDEGFESIFEQQLRTYADKNDVLIAISGSGNSKNILNAVDWANDNGLVTIGITGFDGGKLIQSCRVSVHVPLNDMCTSESVHSFIFHYVVLRLKEIISQKESLLKK